MELFNAGTIAVDISGWYYTDSKQDLVEANVFPEGTVLQPGDYITRNKADNADEPGLGDDDGVYLFYPDNTLVDSTDWIGADADNSWCRLPNGSGDFQVCATQTLGAANSAREPECGDNSVEGAVEICDGSDLGGETCETQGFTGGSLACASDCTTFNTDACTGRVSTVVINEVTSGGDDVIELFNTGTAAEDIGGWYYTDSDETHVYTFTTGTSLEAGEYLVLDKVNHHDFGLGGDDEVNLYMADGTLVDTSAWPNDGAVTSWCRIPNGSGAFESCVQFTPGEANSSTAATCGDGVIEGDELCDAPDLNGETCGTQGLEGDGLGCSSDCLSLDASECDEPAAVSVVINEVSSAGDDQLELYNAGSESVDISGWTYRDDKDDAEDVGTFPAGTTLAPGEYFVIDKTVSDAPGLGGDDAVLLYNSEGTLVDTADWGDDEAVVSYCRLPDGTGDFAGCVATFGATNDNGE